MELNILKKIICKSLKELKEKDIYLLEKDANERSISHKFAEYITKHINKYEGEHWDVDVEYNRDGIDPKRLQIDPEQISSDDDKGVTIYPDIIVHKRGKCNQNVEENNNLLIIEIKKNEYCQKDLIKICKLISYTNFHYKFGLFVNLKIKESNSDLIYFKRTEINGTVKVDIISDNEVETLGKFGDIIEDNSIKNLLTCD